MAAAQRILTCDNLDYTNGVTLTPLPIRLKSAEAQNYNFDVENNIVWDEHKGQGFLSAGIVEISPDDIPDIYTGANINAAPFKHPGETRIIIPDQLKKYARAFNLASGIQRGHDPSYKNKVGVFVLRIETIHAGKEQQASSWHIHRPLAEDQAFMSLVAENSKKYPELYRKMIQSLSTEKMPNEFLLSNICGSCAQTAPASEAFDIQDSNDTLFFEGAQNDPPFPYRQTASGEMIAMTNCWHRASLPSKEHDGQRRAVLVLQFMDIDEAKAKEQQLNRFIPTLQLAA